MTITKYLSSIAAVLAFAIIANPLVAQETTTEDKKTKEVPAALNFTMKTIDGEDKPLSDYQGKAIVVVNVASKCGLTPQYGKLQELHKKYSEQGLAVLGFPCNQFGGQEPGTEEEIKTFCVKEYDVAFDMFSKVDVNGDDSCDFYKHLTGLELEPKSSGKVTWNFEKFLIDRQGNVIGRFGPRTDPTGDDFVKAVEKALSEDK